MNLTVTRTGRTYRVICSRGSTSEIVTLFDVSERVYPSSADLYGMKRSLRGLFEERHEADHMARSLCHLWPLY